MSQYGLFPLRSRSTGDGPASRPSQASTQSAEEIEHQHPTALPPRIDDSKLLRRLGKNPVLKRNFEFISTLSFSSAVIVTWEHYLNSWGLEPGTVGVYGAFFSYIFVWFGAISTYATLAELASMSPTAGGVYYWVAMLAPLKSQKFLSFTTGWLSTLGWQGLLAMSAWTDSLTLVAMISLINTGWSEMACIYAGFGFYWLIIILSFFINWLLSQSLPQIMAMLLILHILAFFIVLVPMVVLGTSSEGLDFTFVNGQGWPTTGLGIMIYSSQILLPFLGADAAKHMSEEIENANMVVPRSMMLSILVNGLMGFGMATAMIYLGYFDQIIPDASGLAFPAIFSVVLQSAVGMAFLTSIVLVVTFGSTLGTMASTVRQFWSFSRERGVPYWAWFRCVDSKRSIPLNVLIVVTCISCLHTFPALASHDSCYWLITQVWFFSQLGILTPYLLVNGLLLYRRWQGRISEYEPTSTAINNVPGTPLVWGPWRIPGYPGIANNIVSFVFLASMWFFMLWPAYLPIIASTFAMNINWAPVIILGILVCTTAYYFLRANKFYVGPWVEV